MHGLMFNTTTQLILLGIDLIRATLSKPNSNRKTTKIAAFTLLCTLAPYRLEVM